jgi:AcrR family transcriptional regulator
MARPRFRNLDRETTHRILETAAEEFAARGFEGTSLNQLIGRLGISKGSFYYYFDDKADLFTTVVDHAWATVLPVERLDLAKFDADTFWPALHNLMREASARVRENPWLVGLRGQEVGAVRDDIPAELLQALLVGADEAGDRWFVDNWDRLEETEIERLFEEVFAIYRRMLERPPAS